MKKPDQYTNRRPVCPMFYLFKSFSLVEFNANDLKNAIQYLKSPSHIADVKIGKVNLVSCLTYFPNEKFVIILDEYHLSHMTFLPVPKWKVLVIAAFNLQGTMFHYLYIRAVPVTQSRVGSRKINSALHLVVKQVIKKGYSNNLVAIVSDHCPANLTGMPEASEAFPILWDKEHFKKGLAKHKLTDVTDYLYGKYTVDDWKSKLENAPKLDNSASEKQQKLYDSELRNMNLIMERHFAISSDPLKLYAVHSRRLEHLGRALIPKVYEIMMYAINLHPHDELLKDPIYYIARVVGLMLILTTPKTFSSNA